MTSSLVQPLRTPVGRSSGVLGDLLRASHNPPVTACAVACEVWSVLVSAIGAVSTCLTSPTNALLVSSGQPRRHYAAVIGNGALDLVVGVLSPALVVCS